MKDPTESRLYAFVGPARLLQLSHSPRRAIRQALDVMAWVESSHSEADSAGRHPATFVVDEDGLLWIADRLRPGEARGVGRRNLLCRRGPGGLSGRSH